MSVQLESIGGSLYINGQAVMVASIGMIIMFNGVFADIPVGWQLCDGTNGTPDMTDSFVMGTNIDADIGVVGGSNDAYVKDHSHAVIDNGHVHGGVATAYSFDVNEVTSGGAGYPIGNSASATTGISLSSTVDGDGVGKNAPAYVKLAYIQRMS